MSYQPPHSIAGPTFGPPPEQQAPTRRGMFPVLLLCATLFGGLVAYRTRQPLAAVAPPALAVVAFLCAARPAAAIVSVFLLTGFVGSMTAFTPFSSHHIVDPLLAGIWIATVWVYASGRASAPRKLWVALAPLCLYLAITLLEIPLTSPLRLGVDSFKGSGWFMLAALLVGFAPWRSITHHRIAKGAIVAGLVVGTYCVYRKAVGASPSELGVAFAAQPGIPRSVAPRFFGSFESANELAAWGGALTPFCVAMALSWRGRWRILALGALATLTFAVFASDVRAGTVASGLGIMIVLLLFYMASAFRSRRLTVVAAVVIIGLIGFGGYGIAVQGSSHERFAAIFSPGNDKGYVDRVQRWNAALDDINHHPLGRGLGTAGGVATVENEFGPAVTPYLDSSYLKVGIEQGMAVMVLYVAALLTLLLALARASLRMPDLQRSAITIGAAGTLAALLFLFYAGLYSEGTQVVAAWLLVGLGIAQVTMPSRRSGQSS